MTDANSSNTEYPKFADLINLAEQVEMNSYKVLSLMQAQLYDINEEIDEDPTPPGYMNQLKHYLENTNSNLVRIFKLLDISGLGE